MKHPLVAEVFNIVGFHLPPGSASRHEVSRVHLLVAEIVVQEDVKIMLGSQDPQNLPRSIGHDWRLYTKQVTEEDLAREDCYDPRPTHFCKLGLISKMSPRDVRLLVNAEEELSQTKVHSHFLFDFTIHNVPFCT